MSQQLTVIVEKRVTRRQELFIEQIATNPKQSNRQAAINAGCPESGAKVTACRWLQMPHIQAAIEERREEILNENGMSKHSILLETAKLAHADVKDVGGATKVKALELLGKNINLWGTGEGDGAGGTTVNIVNLTVDL